jgi:hypothetical protein
LVKLKYIKMKKLLLLLLLFAISSSLFSQTLLTIEGTTVNNTDDTWLGVNIPRSVPTTFTYRNNSITSINTYGYMLQAGDENIGSTNNMLDGEVITGNKFTWNGTDMTSIAHGVFTGHNKNAILKYNYLDKVPMGLIRKSANDMTNTSGGVAYNIVIDPAVGVVVKGMSNVNIYNNTFYQTRTYEETGRGLIDIYTNTDATPTSYAHGTKIKNNIFYTKYQTINIRILDNDCFIDFECDSNLYWCEAGTPEFEVNGSVKTFAQWQALGYDTHSVVINPNFINTTDFVPSSRLNYGTDLGSAWQTGLSIDAVWGTTDPATTIQNGTWQVGARLFTGNVYYLSPTGNDATGNGSIGSPWFTLKKAWTVISAGDIIYMRGGIYQYDTQQYLTGKNGTNSNFISILAFPDEIPVITRHNSNWTFTSGSRAGIWLEGDYFHWKGITVTGFTQLGDYMIYDMEIERANHNIIEQCVFSYAAPGFDCSHYSTDNLILNCDFHHCFDPLTSYDPYGNADGANAHTDAGTVNTFRGCRFYYNSDDGLDLYNGDGLIIIDGCWAWMNGFAENKSTDGGDGYGYKLGQCSTDLSSSHLRTITNSLAFYNGYGGFSQQNLRGISWVYNNSCYYNTIKTGEYRLAYEFDNNSIPNILRNNIGYANQRTNGLEANWTTVSAEDHNSWDGNVTVTNADFVSLDTTGVSGPRQADGSLPVLDFLRLASTSDLIGAGVDVGLPFTGMHPDIGAFEFSGENHQPSIMNQSFEIDENSINGTVAGTIVASDQDMDQTLDYSILSGNTDGAFTINDSTGVLSVSNGAAINADFALVVKVQDNYNLSSQATITINIIPTGIESTGTNSTIKVYPNPVSDEIIIEIEGNNDKQVFEILNSTGTIVFKGNLSERTAVSTSNFSAGVYYIRLQNGKTFEYKKIVKQ